MKRKPERKPRRQSSVAARFYEAAIGFRTNFGLQRLNLRQQRFVPIGFVYEIVSFYESSTIKVFAPSHELNRRCTYCSRATPILNIAKTATHLISWPMAPSGLRSCR